MKERAKTMLETKLLKAIMQEEKKCKAEDVAKAFSLDVGFFIGMLHQMSSKSNHDMWIKNVI